MANDVTFSRIPGTASERWKLVRDVCSGRQAVAAGGYIPTLNKADKSKENEERNAAYRARAVLYNATGRTRDGLVGLAFRRDPSHDLPTKLEYLLKDADGAGVSVYQQSQAVLTNLLEAGRHGLLVDFSDGLNRAVIKSYLAEDIINWRTALVGGKVVLTLVVLREDAEVEDGYGIKAVPQWRELRLEDGRCVCRLWQQPNEAQPPVQIGPDVVPASRGGPLDFIPFAFVGAQNNDTSIDEAPLYDLAEINIAHYRNSADYEDSCFIVGQPQPWISGLTEQWRDAMLKAGVQYIGSRAPMLLPVGGEFGFAQVEPNTMVKEAMEHKEQQMISLGARLVETTRANKTATEADNDKEASTSVLSMCVVNVSEAYALAIAWCARFLDLAVEEVKYSINQDFTQMNADPAIITALVSAWQSGTMALTDLRSFLRRLGVIDAERSDEDIQDDLDGEGPPRGMEGAGDPGEGGGPNGNPAAAA